YYPPGVIAVGSGSTCLASRCGMQSARGPDETGRSRTRPGTEVTPAARYRAFEVRRQSGPPGSRIHARILVPRGALAPGTPLSLVVRAFIMTVKALPSVPDRDSATSPRKDVAVLLPPVLFAEWLPAVLNVFILLIGIFLILLVLIQKGKGGGLAGALGGA